MDYKNGTTHVRSHAIVYGIAESISYLFAIVTFII